MTLKENVIEILSSPVMGHTTAAGSIGTFIAKTLGMIPSNIATIGATFGLILTLTSLYLQYLKIKQTKLEIEKLKNED